MCVCRMQPAWRLSRRSNETLEKVYGCWSQWDPRGVLYNPGVSWGWQAGQNLHRRSQEADVLWNMREKSWLNPMLQPLVTADMLLKINDDGLSYLMIFKDVQVYKKINADLFAFLDLCSGACGYSIQDNQVDRPCLQRRWGLDYEV